MNIADIPGVSDVHGNDEFLKSLPLFYEYHTGKILRTHNVAGDEIFVHSKGGLVSQSLANVPCFPDSFSQRFHCAAELFSH